jgi:hypothetical protein
LKIIGKINKNTFKYKPVSNGDKIEIGTTTFKVLWPPKQITEGEIISAVEKALKDFREAIKKNRILEDLYNRTMRDGVFEELEEENIVDKERNKVERKSENEIYKKQELSKLTKNPEVTKARKSLMKAVNHISLAFSESDRLLFLGDTENFEIKKIINNPENFPTLIYQTVFFHVLITPHHGTHWDASLKRINTLFSVASNGPKLFPKIKPHFKQISECFLSTYTCGNILIPMSCGRCNSPFFFNP